MLVCWTRQYAFESMQKASQRLTHYLQENAGWNRSSLNVQYHPVVFVAEAQFDWHEDHHWYPLELAASKTYWANCTSISSYIAFCLYFCLLYLSDYSKKFVHQVSPNAIGLCELALQKRYRNQLFTLYTNSKYVDNYPSIDYFFYICHVNESYKDRKSLENRTISPESFRSFSFSFL